MYDPRNTDLSCYYYWLAESFVYMFGLLGRTEYVAKCPIVRIGSIFDGGKREIT